MCILFSSSQDDIDIELSGDSSEESAGGSKEHAPKKESQDPKQSLHLLLQRQAKFLENCREVKVQKMRLSGKSMAFQILSGVIVAL